MKTFTVKYDESYDVLFILKVCQTRKEMIAEIGKYKQEIGEDDDSESSTAGMFCPTPQVMRPDIPGIWASNIFGTMYLNLKDLTDEIIVHECAHATFAYEQSVRRYTGNYGDDDFSTQENFCYFIGETFAQVKEIIEKNFKKTVKLDKAVRLRNK